MIHLKGSWHLWILKMFRFLIPLHDLLVHCFSFFCPSTTSTHFRFFFCILSQGPSKRWRHSMAVGNVHLNSDGEYIQNVAVFGGHRLWHGYSLENSYLNEWSSYITRPFGGYLSDLWIYTKYLDFDTFPGQTYKTNDGKWKLKQPKQQCFPDAGLSWDAR
jgi:hypothetical protein